MMKSLKLPSMLVALVLLSSTAAANPLYSWTTKDGTPTYSPDPPPKGVSYVIVGADLQPLKGQPVDPQAALAGQQNVATPTATSNTAASGNVIMTPAPGNKSIAAKTKSPAQPKWKPVIYADDPNPQSRKPEFKAAAVTPEVAPVQTNQLSEECFDLRQRLMLLESKFANAISAQQMDEAVIRLSVFRKENRGNCEL